MPNDSREKILRRIREALSVKAPARHLVHTENRGHPGETGSTIVPATGWLPPVPDSPIGLLALFEKNSLDLKTDVRRCTDAAAVVSELAALALENRWQSVGSHHFALGNEAVSALGLPVVFTDQPYETAALERCDAGVSGCECLVAQTGGILVTSASAGGRVLSVLPPHHVVIASACQMVGDLSDAFDVLRKTHESPPSFASFITGPSRTGDIERILVLGAHGPKKLTVLLVQA
ncbi:MAG: LUD domain-containing protein [Terrimicrobiaceae bacterium]